MPIFALSREVPEWLKGPAWKAGIGASLSRVRIPSSLQNQQKTSLLRLVFFVHINFFRSVKPSDIVTL